MNAMNPSLERRALIAALLAASLRPAWAAREPIVLGQTLAIGAGSDGSAARIIDGTKACIGAYNARGGVNGRTIELVTLDGGRDPATHAKNARTLVNEHGALALLNCAGDANCSAVAQVARELRVPLVGPMSSLNDLQHGHDRHFFPVRAPNLKQAEALARQMVAMGVSRAVLLTDQPGRSERMEILKPLLDAGRISSTLLRIDPASPASVQAALKAMGATPYHAAVMDLQPQTIDRLSELGVTDRPEWPRMLASFATLGLVGLSGAFPGRIIGFVNVVPHPENSPLALTQELNRNAEKYSTGQAVNFEGYEAYINTRTCLEALQRITGKPDSAKLTDALEKLDRFDLGGYIVSFAGSRETGSDWVEVGVRSRAGYYLN
jgi:branched-chain amino acid transport system substrate-binding protein